MSRLASLAAGAAAGAVGAALVGSALGRGVTAPALQRTNYAGRTVSLAGGLAAAGAACAGQLVADPRGLPAVVAAGASGALDDLKGDARSKGLKGHLTALVHGQVTTGAVKIAAIGAGALASALSLAPRRTDLWDVAVRTVTIAGTANVLNLLDLRPGRALKATVLGSAAACAAGANAGAPAGVALACLPGDLAERTMLGDTGANALGAALGAALAAHPRAGVRCAAAAGAVALTLASERISFTQVIARTPVLRELDAWGRLA